MKDIKQLKENTLWIDTCGEYADTKRFVALPLVKQRENSVVVMDGWGNKQTILIDTPEVFKTTYEELKD